MSSLEPQQRGRQLAGKLEARLEEHPRKQWPELLEAVLEDHHPETGQPLEPPLTGRWCVFFALQGRLDPELARWLVRQTDLFMAHGLMSDEHLRADIQHVLLQEGLEQLRPVQGQLREGQTRGRLLGAMTRMYYKLEDHENPGMARKLIGWAQAGLQASHQEWRKAAIAWWVPGSVALKRELTAEQLQKLYQSYREGDNYHTTFLLRLVEHPRADGKLYRAILRHTENMQRITVCHHILQQEQWWDPVPLCEELMEVRDPTLWKEILEQNVWPTQPTRQLSEQLREVRPRQWRTCLQGRPELLAGLYTPQQLQAMLSVGTTAFRKTVLRALSRKKSQA